jgi:hypothetical protein
LDNGRLRIISGRTYKDCYFATYRTVEDMLALLVPLLDMTLEGAGVKWLQQLEATQELRRNRHDSSPIIKLAAVLLMC